MNRTTLRALAYLACFAMTISVPISALADGDDANFDRSGCMVGESGGSCDDNKDDLTVYRQYHPSIPGLVEGNWYIRKSSDEQLLMVQWGIAGDIPVPGQYTDNLYPDIAIWRPSNGFWWIRPTDDQQAFAQENPIGVQWGFPTDTPVPCDWNRNSKSDLGIFRPSTGTWYIRPSDDSNSFDGEPIIQSWGTSGDKLVPRDFDNDGQCDFTVFRNGVWYILLSTKESQPATLAFGSASDTPIGGEFDGDSYVDFGVVRNIGGALHWFFRESEAQGLTTFTKQWGVTGDIPISLDYNGDGEHEIAIWRPSTGEWWMLLSTSYSSVVTLQWGLTGDVPIGQRGPTLP
ncbi:MAG: hypothetical protein KDD66_06925 [Bdellovibrionales bacterium]|nr:hypothetical protein [Bdellovibrionales bacterium]